MVPAAATNIPSDYATTGTWYEFFRGKAADSYRVNWGAGYAVFQYPNPNRAGTKWYHDHTLGMTRVNVYAGPAGFYIICGGRQGDHAVRDARTGRQALLPQPAPSEVDQLIPNRRFYEIPIAIQDRAFNADGSLFYPDSRAFFDGIEGPYIPDSDSSYLESGVLREHDHGQRQHLAVPRCRTTQIPLQGAERLSGTLLDP